MAITLNSNPLSLTPLERAKALQEQQFQRQSSALRINSAKDDAAGLAIVVRLSSQLGGTDQAIRNINDGLSLTDTASGALSGVTDSLQRIRELSVQAANGTNTTADLQAIQAEINQQTQNISDITNNASFNGQQLFSGSFTTQLQSGPNSGQTQPLSIVGTSPSSLGVAGIDVTNVVAGVNVGANAAISAVDNALTAVSTQQANIGGIQAGLRSTQADLSNSYENIASTRSRIADNDYASSSTAFVQSNVQGFVALKALKAYTASQGTTLRLLSIA